MNKPAIRPPASASKLSEKQKKSIARAVKKTVKSYRPALKKLSQT